MSRPDGRSTASRRQSGLGSDVVCQEWGAESGDRSAFVRDARIPVKVIGNAGDRGGVRLASGARRAATDGPNLVPTLFMGVTPTMRSAGRRPRRLMKFIAAEYPPSRPSPALAATLPTRSRNGSPRYCWIILPIARSDGGAVKSETFRRCNCWISFVPVKKAFRCWCWPTISARTKSCGRLIIRTPTTFSPGAPQMIGQRLQQYPPKASTGIGRGCNRLLRHAPAAVHALGCSAAIWMGRPLILFVAPRPGRSNAHPDVAASPR
jgi:hypothetical protein